MPLPGVLRRNLIKILVRILDWLKIDTADNSDIYYSYRLLLERTPDQPGWNGWADRANRGLRRHELVMEFLRSQEFIQKHRLSSLKVIEIKGLEMYVDAEDSCVGKPISQHLPYEPHVTAVLNKEFKNDSVFLDIGANMGWFTMQAAVKIKKGKIIAVEPNPNNLQLLYRSVIANQLNNIQVYPYAATEENGWLQLSFVQSNGFVELPTTINATTHYVQGVNLDELLQNEPRIDIVKIDVEGHELLALKGLQKTLARCRPLLVTEFHPAMLKAHGGLEPIDYLNWIAGAGYQLAVIQEDGEISAPLTPAQIMENWEKANREAHMEGNLHLDLIARPL